MTRTLTLMTALMFMAVAPNLDAAVAAGKPAKLVIPTKTWNADKREKLSDYRGEYVLIVTWADW